MYVDDPVFTVAGSAPERALAVDLLILYWLTLGLPMAWTKGTWTCDRHRWIGADFVYRPAAAPAERPQVQPTSPTATLSSSRTSPFPSSPTPPPTASRASCPPAPACCVMSVPDTFADDLYERLGPLTR